MRRDASDTTLIVIPARAGSTRVKGKNLRLLAGRPLVGHVTAAAVAAACGRVIVSTDSDEIAQVAESFGAEAPFRRPPELAHETATSVGVLLHALQWFRQSYGRLPDLVAFCPPTNPFLQAATISGMVARLKADQEQRLNSLVTVHETHVHPFNFVREREDGTLDITAITVDGKHANNVERSQDLPRFLMRSAACAVTRSGFFVETFGEELRERPGGYIQTFDASRCGGWKIEPWEATDIDTAEDFARAERIAEGRRHNA